MSKSSFIIALSVGIIAGFLIGINTQYLAKPKNVDGKPDKVTGVLNIVFGVAALIVGILMMAHAFGGSKSFGKGLTKGRALSSAGMGMPPMPSALSSARMPGSLSSSYAV